MAATQRDRDTEIADRVIALLADDGIRVTWEYPGFLCVRIGGPVLRCMNYGRDAGAWYGQIETEVAPWETSEVDEVKDGGIRHPHFVASEIRDVLRAAYLRETTPPEGRFPLAHALVETIDEINHD
jgi:hypothetical protein